MACVKWETRQCSLNRSPEPDITVPVKHPWLYNIYQIDIPFFPRFTVVFIQSPSEHRQCVCLHYGWPQGESNPDPELTSGLIVARRLPLFPKLPILLQSGALTQSAFKAHDLFQQMPSENRVMLFSVCLRRCIYTHVWYLYVILLEELRNMASLIGLGRYEALVFLTISLSLEIWSHGRIWATPTHTRDDLDIDPEWLNRRPRSGELVSPLTSAGMPILGLVFDAEWKTSQD